MKDRHIHTHIHIHIHPKGGELTIVFAPLSNIDKKRRDLFASRPVVDHLSEQNRSSLSRLPLAPVQKAQLSCDET